MPKRLAPISSIAEREIVSRDAVNPVVQEASMLNGKRDSARLNALRDLTVATPAGGFMRLKQILKLFPVSASHWWAGVEAGRYPKPVKLSEGITAWPVGDIQALFDKFRS